MAARTALYAGSFDPITNGHIDILRRSFSLAEKVVIAITLNSSKRSLFTFEERAAIIKCVIQEIFPKQIKYLDVISFDTLLVEKAREIGATLLIRGLRDSSDFDYEMQMAEMNITMASDIQTVFLPANFSVRAISSTIIRQIAEMGGDVSRFVPTSVSKALSEKFS